METGQTTAARQRRYRERQKQGITIVPIAVDGDMREMLAECCCLEAVDITDRHKIRMALEVLLDGLVSGESVLILAEDA